MPTEEKPKQKRTRRSTKPLTAAETELQALAYAAGVRYDPHTQTVEDVIKVAVEALSINAFVHRNLWGVFCGVATQHELVAHRLPDPVFVSFSRSRASIKADTLSAQNTAGKSFYVQNFPCFARIREGMVEVINPTIKGAFELYV